MRFAIAIVLIGTLSGSALAEPGSDPFDHRAGSETASPQPAPPAEAPAYELVDPGQPRRLHAKLFLAGGVTLWTVSLVTNIYARAEYDKARAAGPGQPNVDLANHYWRMSRYYGTGLFVAGTAAIGVAAYLYLTAPKDLIRKPIVTPMVGGDQAGVSVVGSF